MNKEEIEKEIIKEINEAHFQLTVYGLCIFKDGKLLRGNELLNKKIL